MGFIEDWLIGLPPTVVYLVVGTIILAESMGVPLPGELTLISASLMAATGITSIWGVAIAATIGAIVGDSIGYAIGRRGGRPLLERMGRRFPKHLGPAHLARAEQSFARWGVWTVFFGRFVALLRILAGPLAGALRVPYRKFLIANAAGGICWAFGTSFVIYFVGRKAQDWLHDFSWVALVVAVVAGIATTVLLRRRAARTLHGPASADADADAAEAADKPADRPAGPVVAAATVPAGVVLVPDQVTAGDPVAAPAAD
jgi:membrane protein DedA with SNARE-associated domain